MMSPMKTFSRFGARHMSSAMVTSTNKGDGIVLVTLSKPEAIPKDTNPPIYTCHSTHAKHDLISSISYSLVQKIHNKSMSPTPLQHLLPHLFTFFQNNT